VGPHVFTRELRDQRVKGIWALFDVLRQHETTHFRDILTGGKLWLFIDTAPSSVLLLLDEELPTRPRRIISADKRMWIAFWGITNFLHVNWVPKYVRIRAIYFRDEIFILTSQNLQTNGWGGHKPWTHAQIDNAKVDIAKVVSSVMPNLRLKMTPQSPYSPDSCPSHFFLFDWLKEKLEQQ
jgi:hypothetical protein